MANEVKNAEDLIANGVLKNGLLAKVMRNSIETKALLANKGSIYVGTGQKNTVTVVPSEGITDTYNVPETQALEPLKSSENAEEIAAGQLLVADNNSSKGLKWRKINERVELQEGGWNKTNKPSLGAKYFVINLPDLFKVNGEIASNWNGVIAHAQVFRYVTLDVEMEEMVNIPIYRYQNSLYLYSNIAFSGFINITLSLIEA